MDGSDLQCRPDRIMLEESKKKYDALSVCTAGGPALEGARWAAGDTAVRQASPRQVEFLMVKQHVYVYGSSTKTISNTLRWGKPGSVGIDSFSGRLARSYWGRYTSMDRATSGGENPIKADINGHSPRLHH